MMKRLQVTLRESDIDWLKEQAKQNSLSVSDLLRRILDSYRSSNSNATERLSRTTSGDGKARY